MKKGHFETFFLRILLSTSLLFVVETGAHAGSGWKRTDANAKVVAKSAGEYLSRLKRIAEKSEGDSVGDYDQADEIAIYMENKLAEAYAALLYGASQSSNPDRFLKRVGRSISRDQIARLKKDLKFIREMIRYEDGEVRANQYILDVSGIWAAKEIKLAKKTFEKEFRTVISEKSRERQKDLPGA